ncbi:hypothetical protein Ciccas_014203 [Cichlidogyrus casuarinus]|uniref:Uncharacterized protein n=1 Tax=Cichlidogyrus casuarinus TaxID=1844966 RepID=A0ABD2PKW5_9PLAT
MQHHHTTSSFFEASRRERLMMKKSLVHRYLEQCMREGKGGHLLQQHSSVPLDYNAKLPRRFNNINYLQQW